MARGAMQEAGEARRGERGWWCQQERPWAEPVLWGEGRRALLRVEVGGCPALSFVLPFQPMSAIITWTSRARRAGGPGG